MATAGQVGQAAGMAAALCARDGVLPSDILEPDRLRLLQRKLLRTGQHIPGMALDDPDDLIRQATLTATSDLSLTTLPDDGPVVPLDHSRAQLLPVGAGPLPTVSLLVDVSAPTTLAVELRTGNRPDDYTPDVVLATTTFELGAGERQRIDVEVEAVIDEPRFVFVTLLQNDDVSVRTSSRRVTGLLSVRHTSTQEADPSIGRPRVEFWTPERRPGGHNLAVTLDRPLRAWRAEAVRNGHSRPTAQPNAWVASEDDARPVVTARWERPQRIGRVELGFDTDFDHAMESVLWDHPEAAVPFCVRHYLVRAGGTVVAERSDNHQTRNTVVLDPPLEVDELSIEIVAANGDASAAVFDLRCYTA
jgi:hypothetical protein